MMSRAQSPSAQQLNGEPHLQPRKLIPSVLLSSGVPNDHGASTFTLRSTLNGDSHLQPRKQIPSVLLSSGVPNDDVASTFTLRSTAQWGSSPALVNFTAPSPPSPHPLPPPPPGGDVIFLVLCMSVVILHLNSTASALKGQRVVFVGQHFVL